MNINATLIGQSIAFFIFLYLVKKYVWPPLLAAMEERKKRIESGILAAERGMAEQQEAEQKAQEVLKRSKGQAAEIIANATRQASAMVEEAKDVAIQEADSRSCVYILLCTLPHGLPVLVHFLRRRV